MWWRALWLMLFGTFRLYPPLFLIWIVRSSLSAPRDAVSGAARICGWAGICAASAGASIPRTSSP